MQRYDSYKDSGIQWLGEIPSHWEVLPGRVLFQENKTRNDGGNRNILSLSYGKIIVKKDTNEGLVPEEYTSYQIIKPGYIIVRCTDLQNDKVSLRTAVSDLEGIITGAYLGLVPYKKANPRFFHYLLRTWDNCKEIYRYGSGLRQSLSWLDFKYLLLPVPSLEEQQTIASYLDTATAKIDEAIAQQQKMIDLLNERKQIIINNAVTKGLNPNAKMKPSGIDWIGNIPEHWEVSKLKHHSFKIGDGLHGTPVYSEYGNAYFINGNNLRNETISINDSTMKVSDSEYQKHYVPLGDNALLISINGSIGHTSFYNNEKIVLSKSAGYIDLHPSACKQYIRYYLMSTPVLHFFRRQLTGSTIGNLSLETLRNTYFTCPPITEQEVISSYLNRETARIEKAIDSIQRQISTLQERKQIIINDVVTGKVKVCNQ
ncbi:MAG: restriction endonuclease subunit S [Bacteroidales bacterium]|nr:restriction endonuclease subunit S [Bacteroidales bacterium]